MSNTAHRLMIKYGLPSGPSEQKIKEWVNLYNYLVSQKILTHDEAAQKAAALTFEGYNTLAYASQADTLEMLLNSLDDED